MTLKLPGELSVSGLINEANRDAVRRACLPHGPRLIYGGLLHHARQQGWKDGWAYHKFIEIFGTRPRPQDQGPPIEPSTELKEWISLLPKKNRARLAQARLK
jgi:hypothetical protein